MNPKTKTNDDDTAAAERAPQPTPTSQPVPPTAPQPGIAQQPVAVEPLETPAPILNFDRIKNPIGKRGRRAAERAARHE